MATPVEAILCGCLGVAFASVLDERALVVALPLFVAALDVSGVVGGAPGTLLAEDLPAAGDPLTLELPRWGDGPPVAQASVADVVFIAAYAAYAQRFRLRPRVSALAMLAALVGTLALELALDGRVPALAAGQRGLPDRQRRPPALVARRPAVGVTLPAWTSRRRRSRPSATAARSAGRS